MLKIQCLTVDSFDPGKLTKFWQALLGGEIGREGEDEVWIEFGNDKPDILFLKNSDPRQVKNRLHLDLRPADQAAEVDRAISLGATRIDIGQSPDSTWVVLADPEGNEFCILRALPA